jgi:hypothetical protein
MRQTIAICILGLLVSQAHAAKFANPGPWVPPRAPATITGEIVAIEPQGERELGAIDARPGRWLYPYSVAKIRIDEILVDETDMHLAQGDTIAVWYVTSADAHNSEQPGMAILSETIAESVAERQLELGQTAAFFVRPQFERWYFEAAPAGVADTKDALARIKKDSGRDDQGQVEGAER